MGSQSVTRARGTRCEGHKGLHSEWEIRQVGCSLYHTKTHWSGNVCLRSGKEGQDKKQAGNRAAEPHSLSCISILLCIRVETTASLWPSPLHHSQWTALLHSLTF